MSFFSQLRHHLKIKCGCNESGSSFRMNNISGDVDVERQEEEEESSTLNPTPSEDETQQPQHPSGHNYTLRGCIYICCAIPVIIFLIAIGSGIAEKVAPPSDAPIIPRITNGNYTMDTEYPHIVLLLYRNTAICSGSIYKPNVVITAAHCFVHSKEVGDYVVRAGEHDTDVTSGNEQIRSLYKIAIHDYYDDFTVENDIAVLQLFDDFAMSEDYVKEIPLAAEDIKLAPNTKVTIIGWGENENGISSNILKKAEVPIVSLNDCEDAYGDDVKTDGSMMCAGYYSGGRDACKGDSGGPMLLENPRTLIGIISWGHLCGHENYFGVYTNVAFFRSWIIEVIKNWEREQ